MKIQFHVQAVSVSFILLGKDIHTFTLAALNVPRPFSYTPQGTRGRAPITTTVTNTVTTSRSRSASSTLSAPLSSLSKSNSNNNKRPLFVSTTSDTQLTTSADGGNGDGVPAPKQYSKLRALKDRMWVREAIEDLTAAEFACTVAQGDGNGDADTTDTNGENGSAKTKNKRAVDFDNILFKLDRRIEDMCVRSTYGDGMNDENCIVSYPLSEATATNSGDISSEVMDGGKPNSDDECWSLKKNFGMASVTYTDEQRSALVM